METLAGLLAAVSARAAIVLAGKPDWRLVLAGLLSLLALSSLIVFLSGTFRLTLFGRALMGAAGGGFWTVGGSLGPAARGAPGSRKRFMPAAISSLFIAVFFGRLRVSVEGLQAYTF